MVLVISYYFSNLAAVVRMWADVWNKTEKKSSNIVVSPLVSLVKDQVSLLFSLGISATPLYNEMSEADKSKVERGQYSIVYGHRSRGWRHTMARRNAHKLSETYENSVRRCWWSARCLSLENSVHLVANRRQRLWTIMKINHENYVKFVLSAVANF